MDVQPTNLQQVRDAIMSTWAKISEECFQHLVESKPQRIKAVLKAIMGPARYKQGMKSKEGSKENKTPQGIFFIYSSIIKEEDDETSLAVY